jgi:hypothetical protein
MFNFWKSDKGSVTAQFGAAIYGNEVRLQRKEYLGRLSQGDKVQLLDKSFHRNEFGLAVLKVRILSGSEAGRIAWVGMKECDFTGLSEAPVPQYEPPCAGFLKASVDDTGDVRNPDGTYLLPDPIGYRTDVECGERISFGTRIQLLDSSVVLSYFGIRMISVALCEGDGSSRGWMELRETSFRRSPFSPETPRRTREERSRVGESGTVLSEFGCQISGGRDRYESGAYLGALTQGTKFELKNAYRHSDEFGIGVIQVAPLPGDAGEPPARLGWIKQTATDIANLPPAPKPAFTPVAVRDLADAVPDECTIGESGASFTLDASGYPDDDGDFMLDPGSSVRLLERTVYTNYFGIETVRIRVNEDLGETVASGEEGWILFRDLESKS